MIGALFGAGLGWATANTRFGIFVGRAIWYFLAAVLLGCSVVGFVNEPSAVALSSSGVMTWLGCKCFVIGNRRGPSRWMRQWASGTPAGGKNRGVQRTPCRCEGRPALEVRRG